MSKPKPPCVYWHGSVTDLITDLTAVLNPAELRELGARLTTDWRALYPLHVLGAGDTLGSEPPATESAPPFHGVGIVDTHLQNARPLQPADVARGLESRHVAAIDGEVCPLCVKPLETATRWKRWIGRYAHGACVDQVAVPHAEEDVPPVYAGTRIPLRERLIHAEPDRCGCEESVWLRERIRAAHNALGRAEMQLAVAVDAPVPPAPARSVDEDAVAHGYPTYRGQ
jgi:hypothetical protein